MPIFKLQGADGKIYRLEAPEGTPNEDLINALATQRPMAGMTTEELESAPRAPSSISNLFKGFTSSALGGVKSLVDVTGAGTGISKSLGDASQFLEQNMSPERQEEMQRRQELIDRANRSGSFLQEAKAYLGGVAEAPLESTVRGVGSTAPSILAGLAALPLEAPAALGLGVATIARIATGAAQGVGEYKGGVFDTVKQKYMAAGYKEPEAERLAIKAQEYSADKALEIGGSALLGALDAYTGVESGAAKAFKNVAKPSTPQGLAEAYKNLSGAPVTKPNIIGSFLGSAAGEAPLEGMQGGFGQYAQNLALQKEGFEQNPYEGVLGSALRDAAVGSLTGGAFGPLNHVQRSRDFALDQYLRTQGPIAVAEQERAESRKAYEEKQAGIKSNLGLDSQPLMLEGPKSKPFKYDEDILQDPVGRITREELGLHVAPEVIKYIDDYRAKNNLPPLKSFSLEDVKDAMTAVNPEGESGALKSLLTFKTGFKNEQVTADDVLLAAEAKEIATDTQGFRDFLERATGSSDLNGMSDVQRFSAWKALTSLNKQETGRETVLKPGTNATRFTEDQYNEGLTLLGKYIEQHPEKKLTMQEAVEVIKAQTNLKTDRDAYTLLNSAAAQKMLNLDRGSVFNVVDRNGDVLSTHVTEEEAQANAGKRNVVQKETGQLISVSEEPKAKAPLPKGYAVTKETVEGEATPAGYQISAPSEGKPLTIVEQIEDLKEKVEQMEGERRRVADSELAGALRIQQALQDRKDNITKMEALGQTDTVEYKKLKTQQTIAEREFSKRIQNLLDRAERLKEPLKTKPVGRRVKPKDVYTLTKDGKVVGKFDKEDDAYASMLLTPETEGGLSDQELEDIAVKGGNLGDRAYKALEARQTKGIKVKTTADSKTRREFQEKADEIAKTLLPMLKKFGLEDVGLNIVSAIQNGAEGSYVNSLIELAIGAGNPVETLRHESLHALKDLGFFTDAQWKALERQADNLWINKYLKGTNAVVDGMTMSRHDAYIYLNKTKPEEWNKAHPNEPQQTVMSPKDLLELLREEAIADAFADFAKTKPPAGMIASIMVRLNNFFNALRNALNGAGFNTADDIFEMIEAGELKKGKAPVGVNKQLSLKQANYNQDQDRLEVSTARPTSVRPLPNESAPRDPITDLYVIDSEDIMSVPAHMAAAHNAISAYNWFPTSEDPNQNVRALKDTIIDNLVWLYNLTPDKIRERAKLWYVGANRIAKDWSKVYNYSIRQVSGVLAVLSPQKDWFMNTTLGERVINIYSLRQNEAWSPAMTAWSNSYVNAARDPETRGKREVIVKAAERLEGKTLSQMNLEDAAYFVRVFDETYNSRKYRVITPEGKFGEYVTVSEEVGPEEDETGGQGDVAWGTYDSIKKAISILRNGSHENISQQLGDEHKVRNFYNNIVDPNSATGSVTIDTHAVAAASFKALSGASIEVLHNFGTTPKGLVSSGGSAMTGASGTYGFIADAYREAAARVGVLPREMQSITWEAVRSIFPAAWKSQNASKVNAVYDRFKAGEITLGEARNEVLEMSGGIKKFAWENDKEGVYPSDGATSYDTNIDADATKRQARKLEPYQIKEKISVNLSATTEEIPGINYLFKQTEKGDAAAYALLQEVATDNIRHLLSGIENVKVTSTPATGLFEGVSEPSVNLAVTFNYGERNAVLPALKQFATNFKQKQIHVRQSSKLDVETEYPDGSYNTPVFTFDLVDSLTDDEASTIVKNSGLAGITFTDRQIIAYYVRGSKSEKADTFYGQIEELTKQFGGLFTSVAQTYERLWTYGEGYGAARGYSSIKGNIRPASGIKVETAKRVAAYLNNVRDHKIQTFSNQDVTEEQAAKQNIIGDLYDKLPIYDMDRPLVRQAYEALADEVMRQYKVLPVKVQWSSKKDKDGDPADAYGNSSVAMRQDILDNNRLQILPTTAESYGPKGFDFSNHPLLQESGLTLNGQPMLYNDLLRAVHDYYAHGMSEVGFGEKGEEAAWKNHMAMTQNPLARWALTMETRAQNSYVNFRSGLNRAKTKLNKRGFAEQKAALIPVEYTLTGKASVDAPMKEFIKTLSKEERLGSAVDIKMDKKFSLASPDSPAFKAFFGDSKVVDGDGNPLVVYHATPKNFTYFDPNKLAKNTKHPTARLGFFTAVNPDSTDEFIRIPYGIGKGLYEEGSNVMPVYVSIKNPAVINSGEFVMQSMALQNMKKKDADQFINDYLQSLRDEGHDGILIKADKSGRGLAGGNEFTSDNWVALDNTQIKSAIGNTGAYGQRVPTLEEAKALKITQKKAVELQEKGDIRFSLKTSFATPEAAERAAYKKAAPETREFKLFFGGSTVKEEGRPQPMFHASPNEFDIFSERKPIFVSPSADKAQTFSALKRLGSGAKRDYIYPLWVRAETPFDYENTDHVNMVVDNLTSQFIDPKNGNRIQLNQSVVSPEELTKELKRGSWRSIEDGRVQAALKELGFDSFNVFEGDTKNLAVFGANQVKSITGNIGDFSLETKNMRYSLKKVRYSDERFEKLWNSSFYTQNGAENKTKGYLAFVNPLEFVNATASPEMYEILLKEKEPLDVERLKAYDQVPHLSVSEKNGDWKITGHEGRHRMLALHDAGYIEVPVYIDLRAEDAKSIPVKMLTAQYANAMSPILMAAEVEPLSYANKDKAMSKFTRMESKVKYSLPSVSAAVNKRVNETTTVSEPKSTFERITEAVFPRSASYFRQEAINRYNQLSVYDKTLADQMGGVELMADVSAEQGALFSDLDAGVLASVMGVGNRQGGVPVYRNGITTVDTSVKGLTALFAPLAKYGDPVVFQHYQFWAAVKRGLRLIENGKERNIQLSDKAIADELEAKYPEFVNVQKDWITFNNGMVKYLVDTDVLSQDRANEYMKYADYIPFYRQLDGRDTLGPKVFQSLTTVKPPRELQGSDAPLADFLETVVRNAHASIRAGMKNSAALKAVKVAEQVKAAGMGAEKVVDAQGKPVVSNSPDTFTVFEKGQKVSYRTPDQLLISALTSLNMPELPFMGLISAPANALRNLVTKDPGFMMVNLMRDSMSAYMTSGVNIIPVAGTVQQFVKGLMNKSPAMEAILNAGIGGGYEFSQNIERSGQNLYADLQKKAGFGPTGVLGLASRLWDGLEAGTTASDMATRAAIYERVMQETGNEAEALKRALEVMNFNRKGRSAVVRILTAAVPFLNARIQGLDVFFRAGISPTYRSLRGLSVTDREQATMRKFWIRGSTMMALSVMYYFAVCDDDEYKIQEQETKDNYWIIPSANLKIAIPFEVGTLFKTIPERIAAYTTGRNTGEQFRESMYRAFNSTIPISPAAYIPQVFKPLIEYGTNFNFFTLRPIVGQGMEGIDPKYQVGPSTSLTFQELGKMLGVSPLKAEQMYKGYTGTMGMYLVDVMDTIMETSGANPKAVKRFEQLPIIKRFALDPEARGSVTDFYALRNSVHTAVATANMLERTDPQEFAKYYKDNIGLLANKDYVNDVYKTLKEFNDMRKMVNASSMDGTRKREVLTNINRAEQNLTQNIQLVRKTIASIQ